MNMLKLVIRMLYLVSCITFVFVAKDKLAKIADDVKASGKKKMDGIYRLILLIFSSSKFC